MTTAEQKTDTARLILKTTFVILPIVAGLDKFLNLLVDWPHYLSPTVAAMLPVSAPTFMHVVGVIEIVAGILVLSPWTTIGAGVVTAWLVLIAINLVMARQLDVAVRDLVMATAAFSLGLLNSAAENPVAVESGKTAVDGARVVPSERPMRAAR